MTCKMSDHNSEEEALEIEIVLSDHVVLPSLIDMNNFLEPCIHILETR